MALKDQRQIIEALKTARTALKTLEAEKKQNQIAFIDQQIEKLRKDLQVLEFTRQDCIEKLKADVIKQKTGVDLSTLFD